MKVHMISEFNLMRWHETAFHLPHKRNDWIDENLHWLNAGGHFGVFGRPFSPSADSDADFQSRIDPFKGNSSCEATYE